MKSFLIKSTVLTVIVLLMGTILYSTVFNQFYRPISPAILAFFYILTNLVHAYLLNIAGKSGSRFSAQYMAISFIKMFFYLAIVIVFVIINKEDAKIFLVNFLLLYVVYTIFEVYEISNFVRQIKN